MLPIYLTIINRLCHFAGFACFKHFFENVNMTENKLKKTNAILVSLLLLLLAAYCS